MVPRKQGTEKCPNRLGDCYTFAFSGRGGLPPNPSRQLISDRSWTDLRDLSAFRGELSNSADSSPQTNAPRKLVEANALIVRPDGSIELVALADNPQLQVGALNCAGEQVSLSVSQSIKSLN